MGGIFFSTLSSKRLSRSRSQVPMTMMKKEQDPQLWRFGRTSLSARKTLIRQEYKALLKKKCTLYCKT